LIFFFYHSLACLTLSKHCPSFSCSLSIPILLRSFSPYTFNLHCMLWYLASWLISQHLLTQAVLQPQKTISVHKERYSINNFT
jgi:hypothetical protein